MAIKRTTEGLIGALFDAIDGLRDNTVPVAQARATAHLAKSIVDTVHLELAAQKVLSSEQKKITGLQLT